MAFIKLTNIAFEYDTVGHVFVLSFDLTVPGTGKSGRYVARFQPTEDPMALPVTSTTEDVINLKITRDKALDVIAWKPT